MKHKEPFSIVHEDQHILAVNKAAGLAVGGDRWDEEKERLDRLVEAFCSNVCSIKNLLSSSMRFSKKIHTRHKTADLNQRDLPASFRFHCSLAVNVQSSLPTFVYTPAFLPFLL
jgi:hypothetical protein